MNQIAFNLVDEKTLLDSIRKVIREEVDRKVRDELMERFLSPAEVRKLFQPNVSIPTLDSWTAKGWLKKYYISGRVYFKYSEVIEAVGKIKPYQR